VPIGNSLIVNPHQEVVSSSRAEAKLFLISLLLLFLELACIRWFPAHVLYLTFFTNTILLACFLGMSVGCLSASRPQNFLAYTPPILAVAMGAAHLLESVKSPLLKVLRVEDPSSPQHVYFGTEHVMQDVAHFLIPVEAIEGFFFLLLALAMVGPGQELGRALNSVPNRVRAYTLNILGSIAGIVLFAFCSRWELSPISWFLVVGIGIGCFLFPTRLIARPVIRWVVLACLGGLLWLAALTSGRYPPFRQTVGEHFWSPYYRIDYERVHGRSISVNLIAHQQMVSRDNVFSPAYGYALPHLLERDVGGKPFEDVLILGAGSGNDVSRALQWGARHVDAVEIDPVIFRLGLREHPDHPYQDSRTTVYVGDGRNFLRSTDRQYDLIVYALVDSLVLHSSYSDIRLESYLFTREAFADVRRHLKPGGIFVMYNYFRQGWIVARLDQELKETFGTDPLILTFPYRPIIRPETSGGFTMLISGDVEHLRSAFKSKPDYWMLGDQACGLGCPNGFDQHPSPAVPGRWVQFGLAAMVQPGNLRSASDDWPFLYLHGPMIPSLSVRGMMIIGGLSLLLLYIFLPKRRGDDRRLAFNGRMFFLGAGFMLVETKAVVQMALLFGSTWMVNTVVFLAILIMILAANVFVLVVRPRGLAGYYAGLVATLALNSLIPLGFFLGMNRSLQWAAACLLVFSPILFAGVIFAVSFGRSTEPDRDFAANIAGAILGGLAENCSMLLGFRYLMLVALAFYALSAVFARTVPSLSADDREFAGNTAR